MTDPLKLAEEIEERSVFLYNQNDAGFDMEKLPAELLAAALRLAHVIDEAHRGLVDRHPIRMHGLAGPDGQTALDAYRKARGAK
jgi:hypothetical protein